jgi:hypothetical protein
METLLTQISPSPQTREMNRLLLNWLNSFPHTLPNPRSVPSMDYLHWLLECHRSQQLPLSLQQAHWAELLELEYPPEEAHRPILSETSLEAEEGLVEALLTEEETPQDPQEVIPTETPTLMEEGEILETLEEGEIPF